MTAIKIRPVQTTAPERIYLQGGPQLPPEAEFGALSEVTWCSDDADGAGIPYVRADLAGTAPSARGAADGLVLVPLQRLKNARVLVDRGFWTEGSKILDELISATTAKAEAPQEASQSAG